ncbi:hypothetical protein [Streptomyces sparsogenes]|uniref:Uncharacterized protein n=1 Tax=Streptomyces sparsogenes DSM 40356 TaxID=1331668 RepID=A0A1R1SCF0_9ACTN|nr:hypothetical protein [Streptomyces sparsogenes]OMI35699.1 hypothetical protein SPAR_29956 [Streptomyces sparsogenes DSM 40356]
MESPVTFDRLYEGAKRFARLAMEAHAEEDQEVFLLHAGVSVERLAKAALVRVHPTLLTEVNGKDDMLLHFAGAVSKPPARLRTIGASTAIDRLRKMDVLPKKPKSEAADLDGLIELRNGVAHLGADDMEDYLGVFTATVDKLLQHVRRDRGAFWESWSDTVQVILDDRADRLQKAIRLRMDQARHRFRTRFADLPHGAVEGAAQAVSERGLIVVEVGPGKALFQTLSQCPACDREAAALFLAVGVGSPLFDMELTAEGLLCGLCGFHLSSTNEVEAAGLPTVVRYSVEDLTRIVAEGPDPAERLATLKLALPTVRTHAHDSF